MAATRPKPPAPSGGGNLLTRKIGPLPGWVWLAIGVAAVYWYKQRQAAAAAATASTTSAGQSALAATGATDLQNGSTGADLAGMLSQLQGQVASLGSGNSGTNQSPAVSPGSTQTGAANQTNPASVSSAALQDNLAALNKRVQADEKAWAAARATPARK